MAATATPRTEDEILDELHRLDAEKQEIRQRMLGLNQELTLARARAEVDAMSDSHRQALLQVVQTNGVASEEAIG